MLLLLFVVLFCGTAASAAAQTAVLSGGVFGGGSPLANTQVHALANGTTTVVASAVTNSAGQYALTVPLATYDLRVTPPAGSGFAPETVQDVEVTANRQFDVILLGAPSTISGTVRGAGGQPLVGVSVMALAPQTFGTVASATTDANGRYSLSASGTIHLQFNRNGTVSPLQPTNWFYRQRNIALTGNLSFDLNLPVATISGTVLDPNGTPLPGSSVAANSNKFFDATNTEWNSSGNATSASPGGGYTVLLLTGSASFTVSPPASTPFTIVTVSNLAISGNLARDFTVGAPVAVTGVVRGAGGAALSGVSVTAVHSTSGQTLGTATTDAAGAYSVRAAAATINLQFSRSGAVSSLQPTTWFYRRRNLVLSGSTTFNLDLPMATVSGIVRDATSAPLTGATIAMSSNRPFDGQTDWSSSGNTTSAADGTYAVRLLTGTSQFTVTPSVAANAAIAHVPNVALTGDLVRNFDLGAPITISGFVRGVGGQAVANVSVQSVSAISGLGLASATTDANGQYSVRAAAGTINVHYSGGGVSSSVQPRSWFYRHRNVAVTASMNLDANLNVVRLNGTVADSNGAPVPNVLIDANNSRFDPTADWNSSGNTATDSSGAYGMLLLVGSGSMNIRPNTSTGFAQASLTNVPFNSNTTQRVVLQRPDTTPPIITAGPTVVHLSDTSVSVNWTTNEPASSVVQFGLGGLGSTLSSSALTTRHEVTLQNLAAAAIYSYRVSSTDGPGNGPALSQTAFFTTQAPPGDVAPPVITSGPTVAAVGNTSAVIQWTTDEPATSRIDFGTAPQLGTIIEDTVGRFVQSHSLPLSGLQPSTTYFLQVSSIDPDGNGPAQSSVVSFTTAAAPDTQAPVITNLRVISTTHNSITVGWTTNEAATTAVSYNDGIVFQVASDLALVTNHEITLAGLTAQRTYNITASSKDGAGNGPSLAAPIQAATLAAPDTTPPVIGAIAIDAGRDRATLTWTTTEAASREVRYGTIQGSPDQVQADLGRVTSHQAVLTGLGPSTTYYGSVIATDASGNPATRAFEFTTQAPEVNVPPTAPGPLTVSSSPNSTGSFVINWGASTDDGPGGVEQYEVLRNGVVVATVAPGVTSYSETGLAEGSYTFRVRASDHDGAASLSSDLVVIVDMTPPQLTLPATISTPATTSTDALVSFTVTASDALPVTVACTPASGSAFPIGETTVSCTADDTAGNRTVGTFIVRVTDPFPPALTIPASFSVNAPDGQGATVTFAATATDNADPNPTVVCTPASGSLFPIDNTTVSCTAKDASNNITTRTFVVTVIAPPKSNTTTSVAFGPATPGWGGQVTLTATVSSASGTPSGSVEFADGPSVLGVAVLTGSPATATLQTSTLAVGSHSIVARFLGSNLHNTSSSAAVALTVDKATPALVVTGGTFAYDGNAHPATVTITGALGETLGPVTVRYNGATAAPVAAGPYSVDATFDGNANYAAITRTTHIEINRAGTTNVLALSTASAVFGQPVVAVATISPASGVQPAGAVTFYVGSVPVGIVTVTPGTTSSTAMLPLPTLPVGPSQVRAFYSGGANFTASESNIANVAVAKASTKTATSASAAASVSGESVRLTATVTAVAPGSGQPGGTVEFFDDGTPLGSAPLQQDGTAVLALSSLAVGTHSITANYAGDGSFVGSSAAAVSHSVSRAAVAVVVTASPTPSGFGEPVIVTADISIVAPGAGTPTGSVDVFSNGQLLGTGTLEVVGGRSIVTVSTTGLPAGAHVLNASYAGDTSFNAGTSANLSHTVNPKTASTSTEITLPPTAAINTAVTLEAAVSVLTGSADPMGSVEFLDGSALLASSPLALSRGAMRATLVHTFTTAGGRQITARYVPSGAMSASASAPGSITIYDPAVSVPDTTRTSINAPRNAQFGDAVLTKVSVRAPGNGAAATGDVDVYVDNVLHTRGTLVNGEISVTITGLARGTHSIVATYRGDATYAGSTSSADVNVVK